MLLVVDQRKKAWEKERCTKERKKEKGRKTFPTDLSSLMQSNMKGVLSLLAENQRRVIEDFAENVADCDLVDPPLYGASFTWSNMRKWKSDADWIFS